MARLLGEALVYSRVLEVGVAGVAGFFLLVVVRVMLSAAFMDVLRCSYLSLINRKPSAPVQLLVPELDVSVRRS